MSSKSKIYYLMKIRDGKIFEENFENDNFVIARDWVTIQGSPANTNAQYKEGNRSFNCAVTDRPIIKSIFTTETATTDNWMVSFWIYDDATNTTGPGPFVKMKLNDGKYVQVGIRNAVSTTHYCANPVGGSSSFTDEDFVATSTARTTGWHKVAIYHSPLNGMVILIDGSSVGQVSFGLNAYTLAELYVCSASSTDTVASFGYIDEVLVTKGYGITVTSESTAVAPSIGYYLSNWAYTTSPVMYGLMMVSSESMHIILGDPVTNRAEYFSPTLNVFPGDSYRIICIDFGRRVESRSITPSTKATRSETESGVLQTFTFGQKNLLAWTIKGLVGIAWESTALKFWQYCRKNFPFGFVVNSASSAFGIVSASATTETATVTLLGGLGTHATDDFTVGEWYVVRDAGNTYQEEYKLASKTDTTLTFTEYFRNNVSAHDYIHHKELFPFMELGANGLGFRAKSSKSYRYDWTQVCQEYNNG